MSHVDRETLHAYLDGQLEHGALDRQAIDEHIAQCGECAGALDDARRVRDRAAQILSASGPLDVSAPSFEQLRALHDRPNKSGSVSSLGRMKAIAWAATIVLAVGTGWYARATWITGGPAPAQTLDSAAPTASRSEVPASDLDELAPTLAQAQRVEDTPTRDRSMSDSIAGDSAVRDMPTPVDLALDRALEQVAAAPEPPSGQPPTRAELREGFEARKVAADESDRRVSLAPQSAAGIGAEQTVWIAASEEDAEASLASQVPVIEGVEVIDYATSTVAGRGLVRVRQRLDRQLIVELIVQQVDPLDRLGRAREESPAAEQIQSVLRRDATNSVVLLRDGYYLTLSGTLPVDSLRALLRRVR